MPTRYYLWLSFFSSLAALLLFAFMQEWIIIRLPGTHHIAKEHTQVLMSKKRATIYYFHHDTWHHETTDVLWSESIPHTLTYLIGAWITILYDEKIITKQVSVQSVLYNEQGKVAYISFDRSPFIKQASLHQKLFIIESLLKTIRENEIAIASVIFLVHHQPLADAHLDMSAPWQIQGFTS